MHPIPDLISVAAAARAFLEPAWRDWHVARGLDEWPSSSGTCGRSSLFLLRVLRDDFGVEAHWRSGTPDLGLYGFHNGMYWQGHAWVSVNEHIIDITADQFGADPVIVTTLADPRYACAGQDVALPEYQAWRHVVVEGLWSQWLASTARAGLMARFKAQDAPKVQSPRPQTARRLKSKNTGAQSPSPLVS